MRSLFLLLSIFVFSLSSFASISVLKEDTTGVELELQINPPEIETVLIQGKKYSRLNTGSLKSYLPAGYPEVPSLSELIWIPKGKSPVLTYETPLSQRMDLSFPVSYQDLNPDHCGLRKTVPRNLRAYLKQYGTVPATIEEIGTVASDRIVRIHLWPIRYEGPKRVRFSPHLKVKIAFVDDNSVSKGVVSSFQNSIAQYLVLNRGSIPKMKNQNSGKIELVISHSKYQSGLTRYLDFKKSLGREVREYYIEGKSNLEIKEILKHEYSLDNPPSSTLLVGNIDQIPSWKGSGDNRWSDFNYTTLDGDSLPDISLGRLPVHSNDELSAFIDKSISREKDVKPHEEILLTAGRDQSLGCPANVTKVGNKLKVGAPEAKIIQKYKTEVSTEEVISAYNQNPTLVVYDGHGNRQGMTEIPLLISSLNALTNSTFPLLLDIACLNANWGSSASPRNFAESILLAEKRGVAGILASGGSGYGHDFFQTIGELIGQAKGASSKDPKINQIGQVILAAKVKHGTQDRTYWNYYGDPSSSVWDENSMN